MKLTAGRDLTLEVLGMAQHPTEGKIEPGAAKTLPNTSQP
jgi:hypothetical protein